jgi:hypothetical protein
MRMACSGGDEDDACWSGKSDGGEDADAMTTRGRAEAPRFIASDDAIAVAFAVPT